MVIRSRPCRCSKACSVAAAAPADAAVLQALRSKLKIAPSSSAPTKTPPQSARLLPRSAVAWARAELDAVLVAVVHSHNQLLKHPTMKTQLKTSVGILALILCAAVPLYAQQRAGV